MNDEKIKLINIILEIVENNVPIDCEEEFYKLRRKLMREIRDLGLEKFTEKYAKEEEDDEVILLSD
ncbi:MAG: hypothetical protein RXQ22_02265 [Sulfolobus sp.]|jgi:hypothetical protein